MDGLRQHVDHMALACGSLGQQVVQPGIAGIQQDLAIGKSPVELHRELDAVHAGQKYIADDRLRRELRNNVERLFGIVCGAHLVPLLAQDGRERVGDRRIIIDHENAEAAKRYRHRWVGP